MGKPSAVSDQNSNESTNKLCMKLCDICIKWPNNGWHAKQKQSKTLQTKTYIQQLEWLRIWKKKNLLASLFGKGKIFDWLLFIPTP